MKNGQMWYDVDGNPIQAHGGMIMNFDGTWYWYGENKEKDNRPGKRSVDITGISCYSSKNLQNWKYEGLMIKADYENPADPLYYKKVCERPKVIYCEKTKRFVMWMHLDSEDYTFAGVGIAVSESPAGPFKLISTKQPNRLDSRDMTVFVDTDKTAYLFHSKDWNRTMAITRLTEDYTDVDGFSTECMQGQLREAPAVCINNGTYYMITSGCTGWDPNGALYATSKFVLGEWSLIDNPCEGKNYRKTFFGQSTHIFEHKNQKYLMLDHWKPDDLKSSGYSILPIEFDENGIMTVKWVDEFNG